MDRRWVAVYFISCRQTWIAINGIFPSENIAIVVFLVITGVDVYCYIGMVVFNIDIVIEFEYVLLYAYTEAKTTTVRLLRTVRRLPSITRSH